LECWTDTTKMAAGSVVSFRLPVRELLRLENDCAQGAR
jgi:hypothetical protein